MADVSSRKVLEDLSKPELKVSKSRALPQGVKILKILDAALPQNKQLSLVKSHSILPKSVQHEVFDTAVIDELKTVGELNSPLMLPTVEAEPIILDQTIMEPSRSEIISVEIILGLPTVASLETDRPDLIDITVPAKNILPQIEDNSDSMHQEISLVEESTPVYEYDVLTVEVAKPNPIEFFADVAPALTMVVAEFIATAEPEVRAEVEARVEQLVIVADRLHELVATGRSDGEEAQQIEAFLCREYEQLLLAVGIEPTDELLRSFIAYVRSDNYLTVEQKTGQALEIEDEGTHEKKLFEEKTVFMKAQLASVAFSRRIGSKLGQLAMVSF